MVATSPSRGTVKWGSPVVASHSCTTPIFFFSTVRRDSSMADPSLACQSRAMADDASGVGLVADVGPEGREIVRRGGAEAVSDALGDPGERVAGRRHVARAGRRAAAGRRRAPAERAAGRRAAAASVTATVAAAGARDRAAASDGEDRAEGEEEKRLVSHAGRDCNAKATTRRARIPDERSVRSRQRRQSDRRRRGRRGQAGHLAHAAPTGRRPGHARIATRGLSYKASLTPADSRVGK